MVDIDKLLELETKAIAAPWEFPRYYNCLENPDTLLRVAVFAGLQGSRLSSEGELIVAMRNNIRPLLLELKAAREVVEAARVVYQKHPIIKEDSAHICKLGKTLARLDGDK